MLHYIIGAGKIRMIRNNFSQKIFMSPLETFSELGIPGVVILVDCGFLCWVCLVMTSSLS